MKVYLVRHGDSLDSIADPRRPLSPKGRKEIEKLGNLLSHLNLNIFHILHSGILRAEETAEILAKYLKFSEDLEVGRNLEPNDDVNEIKSELSNYVNDILIVGHMPFMSRLVSALLINDETNMLVSFETGGLACLEKINTHRWILHYMVQPQLLV